MGMFFLPALVLFLPFIFVPSVFNPYEFPKFIVYVFGIFLFTLFSKRLFAIPKDALTRLVITYGIVVYFTDIVGINPIISLLGSEFRHQGFLTLLAGIFLFLVVRLSSQNVKKQMFAIYQKGLFFSCFFLCLLALWNGLPTFQGRIIGTLGNPNFLGGYLVMLLPFLLFERSRELLPLTSRFAALSRRIMIIVRLLLTCMIIVVIFLSASKGAMVATGIIFLLFWFWQIRHTFSWEKMFWIVTGVCLIGMLFYFNKIYFLQDKFTRTSIWDNRTIIWQGGVDAFLRRPILGYGQENFDLAFTKVSSWRVDNAHNIFLETAVSSGIVGLVIFLSIVGVAFRNAAISLKMSLLAFLIVTQFNPLSIAQIALFWFYLGFM